MVQGMRTQAGDEYVGQPESEASFTTWFLDIVGLYGYQLTYHTRYSVGSGRGFPDWVLCRRGEKPRLVFVELKGTRGRLTAKQAEWIEALSASGQEAYVWWPDDRPEVERVLR